MNSIFILTEDYVLYEIPDVTTSRSMDERAKLTVEQTPVCMCAGISPHGDESVDVYVADEAGTIYQVNKDDCVPLVCALFLFFVEYNIDYSLYNNNYLSLIVVLFLRFSIYLF